MAKTLLKLRPVRQMSVLVFCILVWAAAAAANPLPLAKVSVPEPANLSQFVKDKAAAIRLGKALFWDMQAGSDGVQACASCHFNAGADNRLTNQLNPGPALPPATLPAFDIGTGPNYVLQSFDFPFFQTSPVDGRLGIDPVTKLRLDPTTVITRNFNDIGGSQGIPLVDFLAINAGSPLDGGTPRLSPLFGASRQVTGRNAPSVINAVFNYANFWDGRANNIFNGANPLGPLDVNAGIWMDDGVSAALVKQKIAIANASLASQSTGPPLSGVEMSFGGRSFPELGRKMLSLTPLGKQLVHPNDSVLGPLAKATLQADGSLSGNPGINGSYTAMIRDAFQDSLWKSSKTVALASGSAENNPQFTQIEANFSLFWGLAIQLYEATLVSDRTPVDRFLAGNADALSSSAQNGLLTFQEKCTVCHAGSELTTAAVGSNAPACVLPDCNPAVFANNTSHSLIRLDVDPVTFDARLVDAGFFNIGVRPTSDDPGRGGGPANGFPFPLSFTRLAQLPSLPFATPLLPFGNSATTAAAVDGAFKIPGLRNVELTAPYFHNGSMLTLSQVVEFYTRGGNFPDNTELAAAMQPIRNLAGNSKKKGELVDFLLALTDERVRNASAPFDHPQLLVPSGDQADTLITLAATGGSPAPVAPALTLNPPLTPIATGGQTFSGTVAPLSIVEVRVNSQPSLFAGVSGTNWSLAVTGLPQGNNSITFTATSASGGTQTLSATVTVLPTAVIGGAPLGGSSSSTGATLTVAGAGVVSYQYSLDSGPFSADIPVATPIVLTGLADGTHTVSVLGRDAAGNQQPASSPTTTSWVVKSTPPLLTMAPVVSPTRLTSQTVGGSYEIGSTISVATDSLARAGQVIVTGGSGAAGWSCTVTGLVEGPNTVTVNVQDFTFRTSSTVSAVITRVIADGNFKTGGAVDVSDALKALRIAVGLVQPTAFDLSHGDVAPLVNGVPVPDGGIDVSDALVILRKAVGLISF
jgi:cytochrome c peroxidase